MFAVLAQPILRNGDAVVTATPLRKKAQFANWSDVVAAQASFATNMAQRNYGSAELAGYEFYIRKTGEDKVLLRSVTYRNGQPYFLTAWL